MSEPRSRYQPSGSREQFITKEVDRHLFDAAWLWQKYINRPDEFAYDIAWDEFADRLHDQWDIVWNLEGPQ